MKLTFCMTLSCCAWAESDKIGAIDHCERNRGVSLCLRVNEFWGLTKVLTEWTMVMTMDLLFGIPAFVRGCCLSEEASDVKPTQTSFSPFVLSQLDHMTDIIMPRFTVGINIGRGGKRRFQPGFTFEAPAWLRNCQISGHVLRECCYTYCRRIVSVVVHYAITSIEVRSRFRPFSIEHLCVLGLSLCNLTWGRTWGTSKYRTCHI